MGFKAALIGALILVMMMPTALVRQIVRERSGRAQEVENEIIESWGGELRFAGPVLRVPCARLEEVTLRDDKGRETKELRESYFDLWITPSRTSLRVDLDTTRKSRGIFSVPVFSGTLRVDAEFDATEALAGLAGHETALAGEAEIVVAIENQKGLRGLEDPLWGGAPLSFKPGDAGLGLLTGGIRAAAPIAPDEPVSFGAVLSVQGGGRVRLLPLGEDVDATVSSDWTAPSYRGDYLPGSQTLGEDGFTARWTVSHLSRGTPLSWTGSARGDDRLSRAFFGVDLLEVLDLYALNDRAVKYAILFIVVPFLTMFLIETLGKRSIHPVQYALAGIGNLVFYLLLLSLSEHIPFGAAYLASAAAVSSMVLAYSLSLFKDTSKAWYMGPVMAVSYLYLFITLQSEDWALLTGSVGAFCVIGIVMFVTRRVDWYGER
jgi:inner membrane protein